MAPPSYSSIPKVHENVDHLNLKESHAPSRRGSVIVASSIVLTLIAFSVVAVNQNVRDSIFSSNFAVTSDERTENLKPSNEFERRTGRILNDGLFEHLVRVHSPTTLELESGNAAILHVEKAPNTNEMIKLNDNAVSSLDHVFTEIGKHLVKAEVTYSDGSTSSFVYTVTAKVIRIELRDLSDDDREIYFNALQKFQFTSQSDGVATYGKKYHSLEYILRMHLYGAADKACDHWHDDAGMVNHHVAITWQFEQSLRMIDPRTASHYWDYTHEAGKGIEWYDSPVFNDEWFGDNSPDNDLHIVDKGRFAYSPVYNGRDFSDIVNPYGLLRSPWNTNPTPYVMRYNKTFFSFADDNSNFPTCSKFADVLGSSLAEVSFYLNGELHGPVHLMIGGHWGNSQNWKSITEGGVADSFLLLSKWLWRQGFVRIPESCSDDTPHEDCMPTCPEGIIGSLDTMTSDEAYALLDKTGILYFLQTGFQSKISNSDEVDWKDLLKELCHVGSPGEMFTSSAPQDPTFWPLHGNAERLVGALRLYKNRGLIDLDETWGYAHSLMVASSDTGKVCDWSGVTPGTFDMPTCTTGICAGHKEDDLLPFTDLYKEQGDTLLTNAEFYTLINPLSDELPYAYDTLLYWEACEAHSLLAESKADNDLAVDKTSWRDLFRGIVGGM
jgi:hypothetical protein